MAATQGYENLALYLEGLCNQWRSARLDYVGRVTKGVALDTAAPLRICDLACGTGLAVLLQAAANPGYQVVGVDFNPTHIREARRRATEHDLGNARFYNRGVEETDDLDLGEFDIITMSGAYSWLAPEVRRATRSFVRKHLKPGGFFGVHAMTQPGWGSIEPLWKVARDLAAPGEGDPVKRHASTVALLRGLENSGFLKNHPVAAKRVERIASLTPEAFTHEYLTAHWRPEYFLDVARVFADEVGLVYVGDCLNLWRNSTALNAPRWAAKLLAGIPDANVRETIHDYIVLALDRHALFHKGQIPPGPSGSLGSLPLGSLGPYGRKLADGIATPLGKIKVDEDRHRAVMAAVADRSLTVGGLADHAACAKLERKVVVETIGLLAAGDLLVPFVRATTPGDLSGASVFRLTGFNQAQLKRPIRGTACVVASPVLGHGIGIGDLDARFIEGVAQVGRAGMEPWLRQRYRAATLNRKGGTKLEGDALIKHLVGEFEVFWKEKVPKLVELEILLPS